ncbi:hypothetical protein [Geoglobus ahangari]
MPQRKDDEGRGGEEGGLTDNSAISLISGGIDSPVASYLMLRKGVRLSFLHFYKSESDLEKLKKLVSVLKGYGRVERVYVARHSDLFPRDFGRYNCVYCKILMLKTAEMLCEREDMQAIVMGDNLGQVASQTLDNMLAISKAVSYPIIRPLIGFDKEEIIAIARRIGTYDISIREQYSCPFLPKRPVTKAKVSEIDYSVEPEASVEVLEIL